MLSLYVFQVSDGRVLAYMNNDSTIGAILPGIDGNYYHDIVMAAQKQKGDFKLGAEGWLKWLSEAIENSWVTISEEFPFDVNNVKIIELREV